MFLPSKPRFFHADTLLNLLFITTHLPTFYFQCIFVTYFLLYCEQIVNTIGAFKLSMTLSVPKQRLIM